jgi:hypothetical protein
MIARKQGSPEPNQAVHVRGGKGLMSKRVYTLIAVGAGALTLACSALMATSAIAGQASAANSANTKVITASAGPDLNVSGQRAYEM